MNNKNYKTYKLSIADKSIIIKAKNLSEAILKMEATGFVTINKDSYKLKDISSSYIYNKNKRNRYTETNINTRRY